MKVHCPCCNHEFDVLVPVESVVPSYAHEYAYDPEPTTTFLQPHPYRCRKCGKRASACLDLSTCPGLKIG